MDYSYTASQSAFGESIRSFCRREIAPGAAKRDAEHAFDRQAWEALASFGYLGMYHQACFGGLADPVDWVMRALAEEALASACASTFLSAGASAGLCGGAIAKLGSQAQKTRWLPDICTGKSIGCFALTEPSAGSDAAALRCRAVRNGSGNGWVLSGEKALITNAPIADLAVVMACTDPEAKHAGMTLFVVPTSLPGVERTPPYRKLGLCASPTGGLVFHDVNLADDAVLGMVGTGFVACMQILEAGRISMAHFGIGIAQAALDAGTSYASSRMAFGRAIAKQQAIHFKLADIKTEIDGAQLMARKAAWMAATSQPCAVEASIAKCFATEMAVRAADAVVQIHGGWGYTDEFPAERFLRDARLGPIGEGTSEIQRNLIAHAMLTPC